MTYEFDRFLRHDEYTAWLHETAAAHPTLMSVEQYGTSHEGRPLWLVTITDSSTGPHHAKPAHWTDANIHSIEVTGGAAALYLIHHLVTAFGTDPQVTEALRTRTFYVAPRVNPDGVEWVLADSPRPRRSSVRNWPWPDGHRDPGLHEADIDGNGELLFMRIPDPNGAWTPSTEEPRLMVRVPPEGAPEGTPRYRVLYEGELVEHDGFTIPSPNPPQMLDLNRNFPAAWSTSVRGSGDHPMSEPEIDALVRAIVARPNICGYNAFHTAGGFLLRPSGTEPDAKLPPVDVHVWNLLGEKGAALTGYSVHSVFDDFTFDRTDTMSGAADDWAYYHLGVYGWTTEFWDVVQHATGSKSGNHVWYVGLTAEQELAVYRWTVQHFPELYRDWTPFDHPQLGGVEIGGWNEIFLLGNAPGALLLDEIRPHASFAVHQALCSPLLRAPHTRVERLGTDTWRVELGVQNEGFLPTDVTQHARRQRLVKPLVALLEGAEVLGGPARQELGQLEGRLSAHFSPHHVGTPERALVAWTVRAPEGTTVTLTASHDRAGRVATTVTLA